MLSHRVQVKLLTKITRGLAEGEAKVESKRNIRELVVQHLQGAIRTVPDPFIGKPSTCQRLHYPRIAGLVHLVPKSHKEEGKSWMRSQLGTGTLRSRVASATTSHIAMVRNLLPLGEPGFHLYSFPLNHKLLRS